MLAAALLAAGCGAEEGAPSTLEQKTESASADSSAGAAKQGIISLGGPVTEIVYALGAQDRLVAVDLSSTYPEATKELPQVGYQRTLSAENVLALRPGHILASSEAGPPVAIEQIKKAGVPITIVPSEHSPEGAKAKIRAVAAALGRNEEGERLCTSLDSAMALATAKRNAAAGTPRVLFIYARGAGALQISGTGTAADAMIALAGGKNPVTAYESYKPLTPEAVVAAEPDVILMTSSGLQSIGGVEGLLKVAPGIDKTPAGRKRHIVAMDDELLLGFGPRIGEATLRLIDLLHAPQPEVAS